MMFNATFQYISVVSWWSVSLVEETAVTGENRRPVANHWQPISHNAFFGGRRGRYRMVVGFTMTYAISAYHH
jgi:hypothetical protein